jgi:hypothetical protein
MPYFYYIWAKWMIGKIPKKPPFTCIFSLAKGGYK